MISLKEVLIEVKGSDYKLPEDIDTILDLMVENIGSLDPVLRDQLIYETFYNWIDRALIDNDRLRGLVDTIVTDRYLLFNIDSSDDTSIFTRSFSTLLLTLLIYSHRENPYIEKSYLTEIFDIVVKYFRGERDLRGYVEVYGWAHSVAHTADLLDELALCEEFGKPQLEIILSLVREKIVQGDFLYQYEEDERLVVAIMSILSREIFSVEEVGDWILSFKDLEKIDRMIIRYNRKINIKNFMRSLYFALMKSGKSEDLVKKVLEFMS